MNLLILEDEQMIDEQHASLSPRQLLHLHKVLKAKPFDTLNIGRLNGNIGRGRIIELSKDNAILSFTELATPPPKPLPLTLLLALPRPQMLKRILQTVATMGVDKLVLMQTSKVEKSFWQTPVLSPASIYEHLLLGLEQAKATHLTTVIKAPRFRPFLEDQLPQLMHAKRGLVVHPGQYPMLSAVDSGKQWVAAIGPEGGFIDKEVASFVSHGFDALQLGERILKVETAVTVISARLFPG